MQYDHDPDDPDFEPGRASEDWLNEDLELVGFLITITCKQFHVEEELVDDVVKKLVLKIPARLRGIWMVAYERGAKNRRGHLHLLLQLRADPERIPALRGRVRTALGLNARIRGTAPAAQKMTYSCHVKALTKATQFAEWHRYVHK